MGGDEVATVKTIELFPKIISDPITEHRRHWIDSLVDNILSEFGSVVESIE
jgi:hypothetical protein